MSDVADPAPAADPPAKTKTAKQKKKKNKKGPQHHPKYSKMIGEALVALKDRGGSSRQAILKHIMANYDVGKDEKTVNNHLKMSLRAGIKNGMLKQSKGTGASGSFRLGEKAKVGKKGSKPAAAKPKPAGKAATPKKVKKPKAAKTKKDVKPKATKKAKSPKKAKKSPKKAKAKAAAKPKAAKKAKAKPKKAKAAKAEKAAPEPAAE